MKITEQQMFDYMFCPAKFEMKYVKGIDIKEPVSLPKLLNKVANNFYMNLLNGKVMTIDELKSKWDTICKANLDFIDAKKNIEGYGLLINMLKWASQNKLVILDMDKSFVITSDNVELHGCMGPIAAASNNKTELLIANFSSKLPDRLDIDMKLKYTLDSYAYQETYNKDVDGIHIHMIKTMQDIYTNRNNNDYKRLLTTIQNVGKCIEQELYYPRENNLCTSCNAKQYCKYWFK